MTEQSVNNGMSEVQSTPGMRCSEEEKKQVPSGMGTSLRKSREQMLRLQHYTIAGSKTEAEREMPWEAVRDKDKLR